MVDQNIAFRAAPADRVSSNYVYRQTVFDQLGRDINIVIIIIYIVSAFESSCNFISQCVISSDSELILLVVAI